MKDNITMRVLSNIEFYVENKKPDIWVRRDQLVTAETEFRKLQAEGKIISATLRPSWSCKGSVNFLMQYPD